ncbi:hypothetical protein [Saccharospirillum salsuginis]|nr:hypothetical protein [Saccharospirillum salsuginis]
MATTDKAGNLQVNVSAVASSVTLAVVLWLGATVQELDKKFPVLIYRVEVLEKQAENRREQSSALEQFSLKNGVDRSELIEG